uniref:NADH dehydrogenase subunit 6 n=1 Tax=Acronicta major TaxID=1078809 RepID=UPI001FAF8D23|nr:NADH dehydrogenase subunit 6 [Acronicta major]UNP54529.1 NADH dehydrogenase subunit 6 [Acronicta major]UNP54939.1 NADH dehydrogenase subunit 6 [Acronicta major]
MTKLFISTLMMMMTFTMMFMNNPLSMGLMILIQTLLTCLLTGMMIKTYWFSYILFLTFLGGLLVLFIYVSSIASNEMFNKSFNMKMIFMLFMIILMLMMMKQYMNPNIKWMNLFLNSDMNNFTNLMLFFNNENKIDLNKLYNNQTFMIMMMLVIYLFITLIAVVKITNIFYGPLRSSSF